MKQTLTTKHGSGYSVTYQYAETGSVDISKEDLVKLFTSNDDTNCPADPDAFTITKHSTDTLDIVTKKYVQIKTDTKGLEIKL